MIFFNKNCYYTFLLLLICKLTTYGQQSYNFNHYLVEDGLPHNIINDILQDKKGFMWFATTNGLSKYNGYRFKNYKTEATDKVLMKNNRIDWITEDSYGKIWMRTLSNKNKAYCFDPVVNEFWGAELIPEVAQNNMEIIQILPQKSGLVWLITKNNGCIAITSNSYSYKIFSKDNGQLNSNNVISVFEDRSKNSWILTDRGIIQLKANNVQSNTKSLLAVNEQTKAFYSAIELEDEIWFGGADSNLLQYTKGTKNFRSHQLGLKGEIIILKKINTNTVAAITHQAEFCLINIYTGQTTKFKTSNEARVAQKKINVIKLTQDLLWFTCNEEAGIYAINIKTQKLSYFPAGDKETGANQFSVKAAVLTNTKGEIWVQPNNGSFSKYDSAANTLIPFETTSYFPKGNFSNKLHIAYFDRQGNLWYNTQTAGIIKVTFSQNNFKALKIENPHIKLGIKDVRAVFQDKNKNIWVANKQNQLILFDQNLKKLGYLSSDGQLVSQAVWKKPIYSIIQDQDAVIWIGTRGDGLYKFTPQNTDYNYQTAHFKNIEKDPNSLSNDNIYTIFEDQSKRLWVGTLNGLNLIRKRGNTLDFINQNGRLKNTPFEKHVHIRCLKQDKQGVLYAGSTTGLLVFDGKKRFPDLISSITVYEKTQQEKTCLKSNDIIDFCITKSGQTFIATADGGISKVLTRYPNGYPKEFQHYTQKEGLPSNNILSLLEDSDQNIWITTDYILSRFNPREELFEVYSEVKPIMAFNNFTEATRIRLQSGELLFGYAQGLLHFFPNQIKSNNNIPTLALTDFQVYNQNSSNDPFHLSYSIDSNPAIELEHNQNFFNIEFTALDYINPENIKYAYKLEGFDENWNYTNDQHAAFYTNVPKGNYIFKVKSTNSQGNWVTNERQIKITVLPSIWNTWIAYIIYGMLVLGIILGINYVVLTMYRLRTNTKMEKDMFEMKHKFFIDISHELRTPLTLITGPVDYLINDARTPEVVKKQLTYVSQNTNRLQRLVNQILDFRKIQDQKLQISEINLTVFSHDIFNNFLETAQERNISYLFQVEGDDFNIWADKNALEKILMNLLSNAFKYTPDGKSITLKIIRTSSQIQLQVIDSGLGIQEDFQSRIFNRFSSYNTNANNPSTGIGLSMVKELAEQHHAEITFSSKTGEGSTFSLHFKTGYDHFNDDVEILTEESAEAIENATDKNTTGQPNEKIRILVVEDDLNLRTFIRNVLEEDYEVIEAEDGEEGYRKILQNTPDFVISDIMMPKLNGVDLLKKIRNNIETSHVPVVLLTAKTTIESQLEGINYGADDYITKPFSVSYLKARIINLMEQRKRLQSIFEDYNRNANKNEKLTIEEYEPKPFLVTDKDEEIMRKIMNCIEENIDNNEFSVEILGSAVGLNRTTLYYKIKSLTGYSPVEFIRDIRIKRAAQLLADSQLLIKEIADMTGFSDIKYFTKSFKNKYGETPTEYRQKHTS
ncbi:two-component regulator propeller domain-containing protein [Flavobacterium aquidurense]|uniref:hybrid sensor histidine kinase/response regulator transcription factor n=1 Tax=Flavobacterium aquidurense TaxID=362413 RepID=UPI00285BF9A3|nr:two-component regulator propeller domain-containing protein [Flavobacterium aquidurense]MDR7370302.1 signal transduction histidine kinase/DNA-binding response OmpR family regulator/ligand-binding sensor domain-containing protein [Flavobacterium aquidurense]